MTRSTQLTATYRTHLRRKPPSPEQIARWQAARKEEQKQKRRTGLPLDELLTDALRGVPVTAKRLWLDTPGVYATVDMLRGAWGKSIKDIDPYVYRAVFRVQERGEQLATPRYVLRPSPPDETIQPALDFILLGSGTLHECVLVRAWERAAKFGLRADKGSRKPFAVRRIYDLDLDGQPIDSKLRRRRLSLSDAVTHQAKLLETNSCRLIFPTVTRIDSFGVSERAPWDDAGKREKSGYLGRIGFVELTEALLDRLKRLHVEPHAVNWEELIERATDAARSRRSVWAGEKQRFVQTAFRADRAEQLEPGNTGGQEMQPCKSTEMHGVTGAIHLPEGCGELWPLVDAAHWLHVGKGCVYGLGQVLSDLDLAIINGIGTDNGANP